MKPSLSLRRARATRALAALTGATIVALGATAAADAGILADPGDNCQVNSGQSWSVLTDSGGIYYLNYPQYFRIVSYAGPNNYYGHGNGQPNGTILRAAINQSTCSP